VKIGKTHPALRLRFLRGNKYHVFRMSTTLLRSRMPTRSECKYQHKPPELHRSPSTSNSVPEVHVSGRLNIAKPIQRLRPPFLRHQAEAQITICAKPHTGRTPVAHPAYARRKKKLKSLYLTPTLSQLWDSRRKEGSAETIGLGTIFRTHGKAHDLQVICTR